MTRRPSFRQELWRRLLRLRQRHAAEPTGTAEQDARHRDRVLLEIFETYVDVPAPLFNSGNAQA